MWWFKQSILLLFTLSCSLADYKPAPTDGSIQPYRSCWRGEWDLAKIEERTLHRIYEPELLDETIICAANLKAICESKGTISFGYVRREEAPELNDAASYDNYPAIYLRRLNNSTQASCLYEILNSAVKERVPAQRYTVWNSSIPETINRKTSNITPGVDLNFNLTSSYGVNVIQLVIYKSCEDVALNLFKGKWDLYQEISGKSKSPLISGTVGDELHLHVGCVGDYCRWDRKMLVGVFVQHTSAIKYKPIPCLADPRFHDRLDELFEQLYAVAPDECPSSEENPWLHDQAEFRRRHPCNGLKSSSSIATSTQSAKPSLILTSETSTIKGSVEESTETTARSPSSSSSSESVTKSTSLITESAPDHSKPSEKAKATEATGVSTFTTRISTIFGKQTAFDKTKTKRRGTTSGFLQNKTTNDNSNFDYTYWNETDDMYNTSEYLFKERGIMVKRSLNTTNWIHLMCMWMVCVLVIIITFVIVGEQLIGNAPPKPKKKKMKKNKKGKLRRNGVKK